MIQIRRFNGKGAGSAIGQSYNPAKKEGKMAEMKKLMLWICALVACFLTMESTAVACAKYNQDCLKDADCCSGWCNWTWTDFYCDCPNDYPNPCGGECYSECSNGGDFNCSGGEAYCECPSAYPNQCGENCYDDCPSGYDFECDGSEAVCVSSYYDACASKKCSSGDVFCYDSNNVKQDKYDDCDTSYTGTSYWTCKDGNAVFIENYYDAGCSNGSCYADWESKDIETKICSNGCDNGVCKASYDACASKKCSGGDVYCYDSNNVKQDKYDDCDTSYTGTSYWTCKNNNAVYIENYYDAGCSNGSCYADWESKDIETKICSNGCDNGVCKASYDACASKKCSSGDVYCYDSNNVKQDKYDDCDTSYTGTSYWTCKDGNAVYIENYYDAGCSNGSCYADWESKDIETKICSNGCDNGVCKASYDACASKKCSSGDVYCYDSNNVKQDKYDDCGDDSTSSSWSCSAGNAVLVETKIDKDCANAKCMSSTSTSNLQTKQCACGCENGSCKLNCPNSCASKKCNSGNVWCYDNNGKADHIETNCGEDEDGTSYWTCKDGDAVKIQNVFEKWCESGACKSAWTSFDIETKDCQCGCEVDDCKTPCCDNECAAGEVGCDGNATSWSCMFDAGCYVKKTKPCAGNEMCVDGICLCQEDWECSDWSVCKNDKQTKNCWDKNDCGTSKTKPSTTKSCVENCEILSVEWESKNATDGDFAVIIIQDNGECDGQIVGLEVWEKDWWILPDDFQIDYNWTLTSPETTANWLAVFEKEMFPNLQTCEGQDCYLASEYYVNVYQQGQLAASNEDGELLTVYPYYAGMTLGELFEQVKKDAEAQKKKTDEQAYWECLNEPGTITGRCQEMFDRAKLEPNSSVVNEAWEDISDWFGAGWKFFNVGYFLASGFGCASCVSQMQSGAFFIELLTSEQSSVAEDDFQFPKGLLGVEACTLCSDFLWDFMDNPQITVGSLAWGMLKGVLFVGINKVVKQAGKTTFTYTIDDFGRGAQIVYNSGDDVVAHELTWAVDDAGKVFFTNAVYHDPIWIYVGGKEFVMFNALSGGPIVEVTKLSKAGKKFFAKLFQSEKFQTLYNKAEAAVDGIDPAIFPKLKFTPGETDFTGDVALYQGKYNKISVNVNIPEGYYGAGITKEEIFLAASDHEFGHMLGHRGLEAKGYVIENINEPKGNPAIEYFNDKYKFVNAADPAVYKKVLKGKLQKVMETDIETWVKGYKEAAANNLQYKYQLMQIYDFADEFGDTAMTSWIKKGFDDYFPEGWAQFKQEAKAMKEATAVYTAEIANPAVHTAGFDQVVNKYKLNYWGSKEGLGYEGDIVAIDIGGFENDGDLYFGCNGNDVWIYNREDRQPKYRVEICGEGRVCSDGDCLETATPPNEIFYEDNFKVISDNCEAHAYWFFSGMDEEQIDDCRVNFGDETEPEVCEFNVIEGSDGAYFHLRADHFYSSSGSFEVTMGVYLSDGSNHYATRITPIVNCPAVSNQTGGADVGNGLVPAACVGDCLDISESSTGCSFVGVEPLLSNKLLGAGIVLAAVCVLSIMKRRKEA